ncbi:hypothetical protein [Streptomyces caniscabiei]|uniref:hypothetical protein n=1 Tax=Streptomyces caniscabiei TaxID=2746961 RepID=UPI00211B192D|nr:hypothetical protein [Streptomyces caniscabiei]
MMVLFGRTPCLLVMSIVPWTRMTSGPVVSMYSRNCSVVVAVTVGPPAPPVVPFCPSASTAAKPVGDVSASGRPRVGGRSSLDGCRLDRRGLDGRGRREQQGERECGKRA